MMHYDQSMVYHGSKNAGTSGVAGPVPGYGNGMVTNPLRWEFMQEPLWRWLVFLVAMNLLLTAWNGVIRLMSGRE